MVEKRGGENDKSILGKMGFAAGLPHEPCALFASSLRLRRIESIDCSAFDRHSTQNQ